MIHRGERRPLGREKNMRRNKGAVPVSRICMSVPLCASRSVNTLFDYARDVLVVFLGQSPAEIRGAGPPSNLFYVDRKSDDSQIENAG